MLVEREGETESDSIYNRKVGGDGTTERVTLGKICDSLNHIIQLLIGLKFHCRHEVNYNTPKWGTEVLMRRWEDCLQTSSKMDPCDKCIFFFSAGVVLNFLGKKKTPKQWELQAEYRQAISSLVHLSECVLAGLWIHHYWLSNLYKWFNMCACVYRARGYLVRQQRPRQQRSFSDKTDPWADSAHASYTWWDLKKNSVSLNTLRAHRQIYWVWSWIRLCILYVCFYINQEIPIYLFM